MTTAIESSRAQTRANDADAIAVLACLGAERAELARAIIDDTTDPRGLALLLALHAESLTLERDEARQELASARAGGASPAL